MRKEISITWIGNSPSEHGPIRRIKMIRLWRIESTSWEAPRLPRPRSLELTQAIDLLPNRKKRKKKINEKLKRKQKRMRINVRNT